MRFIGKYIRFISKHNCVSDSFYPDIMQTEAALEISFGSEGAGMEMEVKV